MVSAVEAPYLIVYGDSNIVLRHVDNSVHI